MFYSREHCNYNRHSTPFDYSNFHYYGNPSMHFPSANYNNAQYGPFDHPRFDKFATFEKKHGKKHKTFRADFPGFNFYPRNMFPRRFFGPSPLYETFITPESAYLVFQDPNKLTVQFTQVRRAPNGQQQRVTIQQDFNDQDELEKFLVDVEKKLMTKKTGAASETAMQHTGVVVIEEPDENNSPISAADANANRVEASDAEITKDNIKTESKQNPGSSSETFLKPTDNIGHTDASNENDSTAESERKHRRRSKKKRLRMKKTFYSNDLKKHARSKTEEQEAEGRSVHEKHSRHHADGLMSRNDNASGSQEFSQNFTKRLYRNPYVSIKNKSLKRNLKKLPRIKRRDLYDGCPNSRVAFSKETVFNDLYGGWPNNHIAFSEEAIYDEDQFQPRLNPKFSRSKSVSAKRNSSHANVLDDRFYFPDHRFFDQGMQPQIYPINNASKEHWFNFPPHRLNMNNFSHRPMPFGLRYNAPYGNRSFLQQRQF